VVSFQFIFCCRKRMRMVTSGISRFWV